MAVGQVSGHNTWYYETKLTYMEEVDFYVTRKVILLLMPTFDPNYIIICNSSVTPLSYLMHR